MLQMVNKKKKTVQFNNCITIIEEPINLAEDLFKARLSDWSQRRLDKVRMDRLLSPILNSDHRKKMFLYLQALDCNYKLTVLAL